MTMGIPKIGVEYDSQIRTDHAEYFIDKDGFVRTPSYGVLGHIEECIEEGQRLHALFEILDNIDLSEHLRQQAIF